MQRQRSTYQSLMLMHQHQKIFLISFYKANSLIKQILETRIYSFLVEHGLAISKVESLVDFLKSLPSKQVVDYVRLKKQKLPMLQEQD